MLEAPHPFPTKLPAEEDTDTLDVEEHELDDVEDDDDEVEVPELDILACSPNIFALPTLLDVEECTNKLFCPACVRESDDCICSSKCRSQPLRDL